MINITREQLNKIIAHDDSVDFFVYNEKSEELHKLSGTSSLSEFYKAFDDKDSCKIFIDEKHISENKSVNEPDSKQNTDVKDEKVTGDEKKKR